MNSLVDTVSRRVPSESLTTSTRKEGCSVSMRDAPAKRILIDIDRVSADGQKCDLLFIGEDDDNAWVAPIELKSGSFNGESVTRQLQGGADIASRWLTSKDRFRFAPVLAHGKGVNKRDLKRLREIKIKLLGQTQQTLLIRCSAPLRTALAKA